jgi:hypothetical protein
MKTPRLSLLVSLVLILIIPGCTSSRQENVPCAGTGREYFSATEIGGILCGYSIDRECLNKEQEKEVLYHTADLTVKLSILGQGMDIRINILYKLDPSTRKWFFNKTVINNGGAIVQSMTEIRGNEAFFYGNQQTVPLKVHLPPETEFETNLSYPHLVRDFIHGSANDTAYKVFNILTGEIAEKKYQKTGEEDIILNDTNFHTLVMEETDLSNGTKSRIWLDASTGYPLRTLVAGRNIYLTDRSVVGKITKLNYDNVIFARVNKIIPDFQQMSHMKVRAMIETVGEVITVESLNRPGQKFTGSVTDNCIEGIFEIEPERYNGKNAPPFPANFSDNLELKKYVGPERLIESDDPALVEESRRITAGSKDSWEAVIRLSKWVSENIEGAIPGGTSAINTYKTRQGECGSHSRLLAAFCRAVGIPARLSLGCLYTPHYKGSFGQHAWTEVYMGDAGWIAVDATIFETGYIDAGHIRLGESATFQPKEMEILEYRIGNKGDMTENTSSAN